jgi:hypothetical protein
MTDLGTYQSFIEQYNDCFYQRDINALREMYSCDGDVVYFDNHSQCDSYNLENHINKVGKFIESGDVQKLEYEILKVFDTTNSVCLIVKFVYPSNPLPTVRTTFYLERVEGKLKIRHIHYSFDPNECENHT